MVQGVSSAGKRTATMGYQMNIVGPKSEADWRVALEEHILPKLDARGGELLAFVSW